MSRYGFEESIRDGATMPLHFEPRLLELHIDKEAIDQAYEELTGGLSDLDRDELAQAAAKMAVLVKSPRAHPEDLRRHRRALPGEGGAERLRGAGRDVRSRELRALQAGARRVPAAGDVGHRHDREQRRGRICGVPPRPRRRGEFLDRFRDPADPLKVLIVTSKLLTGFDAPILQAMYSTSCP